MQTKRRGAGGTNPAGTNPASTDPARSRWLHGIRFSGFSIVMLGLIVLAVVVLAPSLKLIIEQRQEIAALQQTVSDQQRDVEALTAQRERWNDRSYIVSQARDRLYYVMPGEVSYLVINDLPEPVADDSGQPVSEELGTTATDWVHTLFTSVMTAGLAEVAPEPAP